MPLLEGCKPVTFSSVQSFSPVWIFMTHEMQHARNPCPSPTPRVSSNSCPLSQWCHPTISSSVIHVSSCLQSFPASGSFPVSQFFSLSGQNIEVSALASVFPVNIQDWFPSSTNIVLIFSCHILNDWTVTIILTSYTSGIIGFLSLQWW